MIFTGHVLPVAGANVVGDLSALHFAILQRSKTLLVMHSGTSGFKDLRQLLPLRAFLLFEGWESGCFLKGKRRTGGWTQECPDC